MNKLVLALLLATGCTDDVNSGSRQLCTERVIGDPKQPISISIVSRDRTGGVRDVTERAPAEISLSDGSSGLAFGIHAQNLDGCAVAVTMRSTTHDEIRGGTLVQLDSAGRFDPHDLLQFVELPGATASDAIAVVLQDARGRWASATYSP